MRNITHAQTKQVIRSAFDTKTPMFLWGTMGIGKSTLIREQSKKIAEDLKLEFLEGVTNGKDSFSLIDVRISQLEPADLRGLPKMDNNETIWCPPNWLPKDKDSHGILFFDELNLAPPSIQASAYQLILDRRLGDYVLPDGWIVISAGNTSDDKANIFELSAPLSNRFIHAQLKVPNKEEWGNWALANGIDTSIVSFIDWKPSYLYKFDKKNKDKAFATPRTWEYVSRLTKGRNLKEEDKEILIASAVGEGIAIEFMSFLKLQKKINLDQILNNPQSVEKITEIDLKYALLTGIAERFKENPQILEKSLEVCRYLEPEFAIMLLRYIKAVSNDLKVKGKTYDIAKELYKIKIWQTLAKKYARYLLDLKEDD